jgi:hypothetical protein
MKKLDVSINDCFGFSLQGTVTAVERRSADATHPSHNVPGISLRPEDVHTLDFAM